MIEGENRRLCSKALSRFSNGVSEYEYDGIYQVCTEVMFSGRGGQKPVFFVRSQKIARQKIINNSP